MFNCYTGTILYWILWFSPSIGFEHKIGKYQTSLMFFLERGIGPKLSHALKHFLKLPCYYYQTVPNYLKKCVDFVNNIVSNPWKYQTVWRVESSQWVNFKLIKYYMASTCFSNRIWRLNSLISTTLAIQLIFELYFYFGICLDVYCATKFQLVWLVVKTLSQKHVHTHKHDLNYTPNNSLFSDNWFIYLVWYY